MKTLNFGSLGNVDLDIVKADILKETTLLTGTPPPVLGEHNREGRDQILKFRKIRFELAIGQVDLLYASVLTINYQ